MKTELQRILYWLKAFWPRWEISDLSLNHQERRLSQRALRNAAPKVIIAYLVFGIFACQFIILFFYALAGQSISLREIISSSLILFALGIGVQVFLSFWRIYFAATGRAARMIAQRHQRGDWELIYISPVDKGRWLRAQLQALTWQVWHLLRATMILQAALLPFWIYVTLTAYQDSHSASEAAYRACVMAGGCSGPNYQDSFHLPILLYILLSFPLMLGLFISVPLSLNALYTTSATLIGSASKSPILVMSLNFGAVYLLRLFLAFSWLAILLIFDSLTSDMNAEYYTNTTAIYTIIAVSAVIALFWEWIPLLLPALLEQQQTASDHILITLGFYLAYLIAYMLLPLLMIYLLSRATARRLERPP